jgi:hypothetical protein
VAAQHRAKDHQMPSEETISPDLDHPPKCSGSH